MLFGRCRDGDFRDDGDIHGKRIVYNAADGRGYVVDVDFVVDCLTMADCAHCYGYVMRRADGGNGGEASQK